MKTRFRRPLPPAVFCAISALLPALHADTVTLAPESGTTTNAFALYTGDTSVEIAGPGTVRLNPGNIHTGGTTVTGGTLELSGDFEPNLPSPVGMGPFTVSGGTLRGSGTFGENITGSSSVTVEAPDGWTWTGANTFANAIDLTDGTLEIAGGTTVFSANCNVCRTTAGAVGLRITGGDVSFQKPFYLGGPSGKGGANSTILFEMIGGTASLRDNNLQVASQKKADTTVSISGGTFDAAKKNVVVGYVSGPANAIVNVSGTGALRRVGTLYAHKNFGAGNLAINVRDGGTFGFGCNSDVNGSGLYSNSGTATMSLLVDGGTLSNDRADKSAMTAVDWIKSTVHSFKVGPGGAVFTTGNGNAAGLARILAVMAADPAEAGVTAQGVVFDKGAWGLYAANTYEGPTVIKNGATLFLDATGSIPSGSTVTVAKGGELRTGGAEKTVSSLTLEDDAILGFGSSANKLIVSDSITLPARAKIALYTSDSPTTAVKNTEGTYSILQVPAAYASELEAVQWSCATPASGKVYSFSVATSGSTATLSMTIADAASAEDAVATSGGTMVVSGNLNVDSAIDVRGTLTVSGNVYGTADNGVDHSLTIHDGGVLEVRNGFIRPIQQADYFFDLYLEEGGSIIVRSIEDGGDNSAFRDTSQTGPAYFHFNGGTIYPVGLNNESDGNRFYLNYQPATIGEHGLIIDLAKWERPEGFTWSTWDGKITSDWVRASVQGHVNHDPDCAGDDGGITVRGIKGDRSMVLFGGRFAGSTLTGGIRAEDGATVGATANSLAGQTLSLAPGSRFRPYNNTSTMSIGNLTLGETGATEPVALDGSNSKTLYNIVVTDTLDVRSPVAFSVCSDWYKDSAPMPGVYTALVYQASCSVNPALFSLPAGTLGYDLSAEEVTLSSGDYSGWKALVCTIAVTADDLVVTGSASYPTPKTVSTDAAYGKIIVGGSYGGEADPVVQTTLTISGNVTASTGLYLGYNPAPGPDAATGWHQGFLTLDGGSITAPVFYSVYRPGKADNNDSNCRFGCNMTINDGLLDIAGDVRFAYDRSKYGDNLYSRLEVNGGKVAVGGRFYLQYCNTSGAHTAPGSIVLNGGEVDVKGLVDMGRNAQYQSSKSYDERFGIWLNGGLLKAENIMMSATAKNPKLVFNGGTYMPYGAAAANRTMENLNKAYVSAGGAVVSTENIPAGETYTIAQPLLTDPALSGATDGGLTKKGAGTLVLTGANTFTGPVRVEKGGLVAGSADALSDSLAVSTGAGLYASETDLSFEDVAASGTIKADSVTVSKTLSLASEGSLLSVDGDLTLESGAAIDFGLGEGDDVSAEWIPVAAASGDLTAPASLRANNAGEKNRCLTMVVDGVLYVCPTSSGFVIIMR